MIIGFLFTNKTSHGAADISVGRYTPGSAAFGNNLKAKSMPNLKWRRVMLKISGAALAGDCQSIDPKVRVLANTLLSFIMLDYLC